MSAVQNNVTRRGFVAVSVAAVLALASPTWPRRENGQMVFRLPGRITVMVVKLGDSDRAAILCSLFGISGILLNTRVPAHTMLRSLVIGLWLTLRDRPHSADLGVDGKYVVMPPLAERSRGATR